MYNFKEGLYSDVRIEDRFTTSVRYRNGALEECRHTSVKKAFIRVYDGKMWYYASTCRTENIQEELDKLSAMAQPDPDIAEDPVVRKLQSNKAEVLRFADNCVKDVSAEKKRALLERLFPAVQSSPYVKMFIAAYADRCSVFEFFSSKGAEIKYDFQLCGAVISAALANEKDNFSDAAIYSADSFEELKISGSAVKDFIAELENFLLNAKSVKAGVYPVILSPVTAGVFAHESFGHKSEADFMLGDENMKKEWTLGKKVGAEMLSIYDSGKESGSGYVPFDDEGTRAGKTYLIKNGCLAGRLHSASTAADLGEEATGNARAVNCDFEPIVRMTSTIIEAGTTPEEELFSRVKRGYYIKSCKHGSGMSTFTIAPARAYEIVDGKIGAPVKIAVISGNVFSTLNLIDGLSDKSQIISNIFGGCGKNEQFPLSVSYGGPYVSISEMNVQ